MLLPLQGFFMSKNSLINAVAQYAVLCFRKAFNICFLYRVSCAVMREAFSPLRREKNNSVKREVPL